MDFEILQSRPKHEFRKLLHSNYARATYKGQQNMIVIVIGSSISKIMIDTDVFESELNEVHSSQSRRIHTLMYIHLHYLVYNSPETP